MSRISTAFYFRPAMIAIVIAALLGISILVLSGCTESEAVEVVERADIIVIDGMQEFGHIDRPAVLFPHDLHTEALAKEDKSCEVCHIRQENGKYAPLFKRTAVGSYQSDMDVYHDGCIDCHTVTENENTGPVTCGECHRRDAKFVSTWTEIGFDKSLHFRHTNANMEECDHCHHVFDDTQQKLVYKKNEESSCRDCHKKEKTDNRRSLEQAAHYQCFGCHLENDKTGPTTCAGCHDKTAQQGIKVVENPARLFRNQPDNIYLTAFSEDLKDSKLPTVPFSHVKHEGFLNNCRACHHETMKACNECHLLNPTDDAEAQVSLQQAMHDIKSGHSCVGCHDLEKSNSECAGCHDMMEQGKLSEHACTICHAGPKPERFSGSNAIRTFSGTKKANSARLSFRSKDIPDTVTIGRLSDKYEPAVFPHRKIIDVLLAKVGESKIAEYFHGSEDVICQGCHHHSPVGETPPLCESCHTKPFNKDDIHKPGLYGAFHRQCLGCHQSMNITEPSDCVGCHARKTGK